MGNTPFLHSAAADQHYSHYAVPKVSNDTGSTNTTWSGPQPRCRTRNVSYCFRGSGTTSMPAAQHYGIPSFCQVSTLSPAPQPFARELQTTSWGQVKGLRLGDVNSCSENEHACLGQLNLLLASKPHRYPQICLTAMFEQCSHLANTWAGLEMVFCLLCALIPLIVPQSP